MVYKIMSINDLTQEMSIKYFSMLTPAKQNKLLSMENRKERSVLFCAEIISRKCLSELCDAPEFSFDILCNPNSRSAVGNYTAQLSVVSFGEYIACAASYNYIGIGISPIKSFTFKEAQEILNDTEIRWVFSDSSYSFNQIINLPLIEEKSSCERFALLSSLKEAYFNASGRGIRTIKNKVDFTVTEDKILCSESVFDVLNSFIDKNKAIAISVIERKNKNE